MNEHDDNNTPVEKLLERLRPADPPAALMARLTAARASVTAKPERKPALWAGWLARWIAPAAVAACAAVVTVKFLNFSATPEPQKQTAKSDEKPSPVLAERELVHARDVGVMVAPDQRPYRMMEVEWLDSNTVQPAPNAPGVRLETRRRQIVPVELEIY